MMIGFNEVVLNEATVIKALQFYFEETLFQEDAIPVITSVEYLNNNYHIQVKEPEE